MTGDAALRTVRDYHTRTVHRLDRYAPGPETLDWDAQPDPFRRFAETELIPLPLPADRIATGYADLFRPGTIPPAPLQREPVATLFELSLGLAAWKQYGTTRWALRCNPSSGNLHPTEGYAVLPFLEGIGAGVHHYASREHGFEARGCLGGDAARMLAEAMGEGCFLVGLSSIHWREAWKYGERAFRYCQLDVGHAIGALRYAAAALGWRVVLLDHWSDAQVAQVLGLDRGEDFKDAEPEQPEVMLLVDTRAQAPGPPCEADAVAAALASANWRGSANRLDPRPLYEWPVIDEVEQATRKPVTGDAPWLPEPAAPPMPTAPGRETAAALIRRRRSTQAYDGSAVIPAETLFTLLDRTLPRRDVPPWDAWPRKPRIHPVLFVHSVEGLAPGLYALPRHPGAVDLLRGAMRDTFAWDTVPGCPEHLHLFHLLRADARRAARTLSCHQDIAAHAAFSLAMLAEFEPEVSASPWRYRALFQEAGLLGQALYLEAEAHGLRGTGIGCFFDDAVHETLGLRDQGLQSLYHFAVGVPLTDQRLVTLPPYHHLGNRG